MLALFQRDFDRLIGFSFLQKIQEEFFKSFSLWELPTIKQSNINIFKPMLWKLTQRYNSSFLKPNDLYSEDDSFFNKKFSLGMDSLDNKNQTINKLSLHQEHLLDGPDQDDLKVSVCYWLFGFLLKKVQFGLINSSGLNLIWHQFYDHICIGGENNIDRENPNPGNAKWF